MVGEELRALAVAEAEEYDVYLVERQLVGEAEVRLAVEAGVYVGQQVAGVALAVDEYYFRFGVVEQ